MAAAMEVKEKLNDITDCPICLETYKEPKILPCIHTFCMHCLRKTGEKLNKNPGDTMPCPVCRKEFTVPETGFGGLQKNFFMDKLTEIKNILQPSSAQNLCDACREDNESLVEADIPSAEMYCVQCHQMLCSECHKHHRKQKLTKNHKIIVFEGLKSEDMQETLKTDSCEKHLNSLLEIYCSGCQGVVCAICFVENHQAHVGSDVKKVASDFRKAIKLNVDEFSSLLPQLKQEEMNMDKYKVELMSGTEDMQTKINRRRQELKELVDKHADLLLLDLDSIRQQNLKKCELNKENIETLLVCLESYNSYCLQLTTIGSATDICRVKTALDARTTELKQLHISSGSSSYQLSQVSLKITERQDGLRSPDQNIVGELEEHLAQNLGRTKDDYLERSLDGKSDDLHSLSHHDNSKSTPRQEDEEDEEEDGEEFLECVEWNLDTCVVTDSIELECLSELELMLKSKVKGRACTTELSLDDKLKELKQKITSMLETIKTLHAELENEGVHLNEVEKDRDMLVDRTKYHESNEQKLRKMVEDLKSQNVVLKDLLSGGKKQATKIKGQITCDAGITFSKTLETISAPNRDTYRVFGIAILANELYVLGNDSIVIIHDLSTLRFRRRWKMPSEGDVDDLKQCDTNKCLYIMKVGSTANNEILRVDPYGKVITTWSVGKARGRLSVTQESNVLLTVSQQSRLQEYAPDGTLVQIIRLSWNSGIENPSHAIKLTSEYFLVCHGNKDAFCRVCIVSKAGDVLKYFGEPWNRAQRLNNPSYLDLDGGGNILFTDYSNGRVLLFSSNLEPKLNLGAREARYPWKICFDKSNGRVLIVENVAEYDRSHNAWVQKSDVVSIFTVNNQ